MKITNENKKNKGITLVSLVVTIVMMLIIISTTSYISFERFKINQFNKMKNDIELLSDRVGNYYLKNSELPILKDKNNNNIKYIYTTLDFGNTEDYYIINLSAMENIALNYGAGFEKVNLSDDVYVININSHVIYYARGIEYNNIVYYSITNDLSVEDNVSPTTPEINIIEGDFDADNKFNDEDNVYYTSKVSVEFVPGKDNWSGISETTYKINDSAEENITNLENNILTIENPGDYEVVLTTKDNNGNTSMKTLNIHIKIKGRTF